MHNTLVAAGPDFKSHFVDERPTGNADVAPTIRHLLGFPTDHLDGRVFGEALTKGHAPSEPKPRPCGPRTTSTARTGSSTSPSRASATAFTMTKATAAPAPRHTPLASLSSQGELGCTER